MSEIQFVAYDPQKILDDGMKAFEEALGIYVYPGDERRIFLEQLLQIVVGIKSDINESAKQNLLRYSSGQYLDALGEFWNVSRLAAQKAKIKMQFTLSTTLPTSTFISKGTRVTPDGTLYYATAADLIIPAGTVTGEVVAESTEGGQKYNGFAPGKITTIVDPMGFVATAQNLTESAGGTDIEDDERYRARIRLAPESISTAGPRGAYEFWAKSADPEISSISVTSPAPGEVLVCVLLQGGEIPTQEIISKVQAALSDERRRPLTDHVTVQAPTQVDYDAILTYYVAFADQTKESIIRTAVENAVLAYTEWQRAELGRAINPDQLRKLILDAGAYRAVLTAPEFTELSQTQVAKLNIKTITYGGLA